MLTQKNERTSLDTFTLFTISLTIFWLCQGITSEINNHSFIDHSPLESDNDYRLRQMDFDGAYKYSNVVSVKLFESSSSISISPNTFDQQITLYLNKSKSSNRQIAIYNLFSRIVFAEEIKKEDFEKVLNLAAIPSGAYTVVVSRDNAFIETWWIVKR